MNIFITGVDTELGRRILPLFLSHGHDVSVLIKNQAYGEALQRVGVRVILGDPKENTHWIDSLPQQLDYILNLASPWSLNCHSIHQIENKFAPELLQIVHNLLFIAKKKNVKKFFQVCNAFFYKECGETSLNESSPRDPLPENYGMLYSQAIASLMSQKDIRKTFLVSAQYTYLSNGQTIPEVPCLLNSIYLSSGSGENMIQIVHIEDLAGGIVHCIEKELEYEILNISDNKPIMQKDFLGIISQLTGKTKLNGIPSSISGLLLGDAYAKSISQPRILKNDLLLKSGYWFKYPDYTAGFATAQLKRN